MEKKCRSPNKETRRGVDLLDLVFSWSLKDVLDKDYKEKVKQIPERFSSTVEYLNSFIDPLIEETHADFCSALENVAQAPVCEITMSIAKQMRRPPQYGISTTERLIDERDYMPKPGDVFLLTSSILENAEHLDTSLGETFLMAFLIGKGNRKFCEYNILTSKEIGSSQSSPRDEPRRLYATYMINLTTYMRIWWGLKRDPQSPNLSLLKSVLHYDSSVTEQNSCSVGFSEEDISVSDLISSFSLDESQKSAILSSISMKSCSHDAGCSKVKLIWGPPGTGKTKTVASLLFALLKLKCKTLTCAPTNIAVVQVVKRLMSLVITSHDKHGNCRVGDIVLFGNADKMNAVEDDALAKVFLSNRVQILRTYIRKWESTLQSIMTLLSNPQKQYDEYIIKAKEGNSSTKMTTHHKQLCHLTNLSLKESRKNCVEEDSKSNASLYNSNNNGTEERPEVYLLTLEEFQERTLYSLAETLILCANKLFTHLPTSCIPGAMETDTVQLVDLLKKVKEKNSITLTN